MAKKQQSNDSTATVKNAIAGDSITLTTYVEKNGKRVQTPITFAIPSLDDLPRTLRRKVRQAQVKYAAPATHDRSGGRFDMFTLAFEVGEMIAEHHGARLNLDDDTLGVAEADAQDAAITALGMRILASQAKNATGDDPNDSGDEAAQSSD